MLEFINEVGGGASLGSGDEGVDLPMYVAIVSALTFSVTLPKFNSAIILPRCP